MGKYTLTPIEVPNIETKYRRIQTKLPVPESLSIFEALKESEPRSMMGQPPIVIHRAEGYQVWDRWGNCWIDWSSGVLITNSGHGRKEITTAIQELLNRPFISSYVFVHEQRAELTKALQVISPDPSNYRVFLLTTGSEAIENAIKLSLTYALQKHGHKKCYIISFENSFHGRTLGAQLAGGIKKLKEWIPEFIDNFIQLPFPDGYKNEDTSFELFLSTLEDKGIKPNQIAAVLTESYQGGGPDFLPVEYAQKLEKFCREHDITTIYDEVQSGFGRTGKMFCYEHYGVKPDLIVCGKGITSSLPLSAVIGRKDIMELYPSGTMTSTHSASPLPVASAVENIKILKKEKLAEHAKRMGDVLMPGLASIQKRYSNRLGCLHGKGLVAGIRVVKKGTKEPDPDTALRINEDCFHKGLLMFAPVGTGGECIKISPPLIITEDVLKESLEVLEESCHDVLG